MKIKLTFFLFALALTTSFAQTIRRVNPDVKVVGVNVYKTIQAAHDAAVAGDVLIVEPSITGSNVGNLNCSKKLTIYGSGYYLNKISTYSQLSNNSFASSVFDVNFNLGSDGSSISGLIIGRISLYGSSSPGGTITGVLSNIKISRCILNYGAYYDLNNYTSIAISSCSNITIAQNYFDTGSGSIGVYGTNTFNSNNIFINNNYIANGNSTPILSSSAATYNLLISNNVIKTLYGGANNAVFSNNIFLSSGTLGSFTNCTFNNNAVGAGGSFGNITGVNNTSFANITTQFAPNPTTADAAYILVSGSSLLTSGTSGSQVGMFGGTTPYIIGGIPATPSITNFFNSGIGNSSTPISATVSAISNK